jgi:hypothetical protein
LLLPPGFSADRFSQLEQEDKLTMFSPSTIVELLSERPFVPLIVATNDGRERIIAHPELAILGRDFLMIAMKSNGDDLPDRGCFCALSNIASIEPVSRSAKS